MMNLLKIMDPRFFVFSMSKLPHCQKVLLRSLDSLFELRESYPVHIVFSDTEEDKIPEFFEVQEKNIHIKLSIR